MPRPWSKGRRPDAKGWYGRGTRGREWRREQEGGHKLQEDKEDNEEEHFREEK